MHFSQTGIMKPYWGTMCAVVQLHRFYKNHVTFSLNIQLKGHIVVFLSILERFTWNLPVLWNDETLVIKDLK